MKIIFEKGDIFSFPKGYGVAINDKQAIILKLSKENWRTNVYTIVSGVRTLPKGTVPLEEQEERQIKYKENKSYLHNILWVIWCTVTRI